MDENRTLIAINCEEDIYVLSVTADQMRMLDWLVDNFCNEVITWWLVEDNKVKTI